MQKRVNTSFMLPPFCMEMTRRWSSSLIHTRKVLLSLCLGEGHSQGSSLDCDLRAHPGKLERVAKPEELHKSLRCSFQLYPEAQLRSHRTPQKGFKKP